jgi:predicted metal-dependent phosphoesterase TrpH
MRVGRCKVKGGILILLLSIVWSAELYAQTEAGKWYKGDLHTHSTHSDGDSPVADVIASAESLGFDFFALTDHDTSMVGNPTHWSDPDYHSEEMVLLYGVEWTSALGHANVWASAPFSYHELWKANQAHDAHAAMQAAHAQGALFSINHPAAFLCCPWEYDSYHGADSIEVWNSMYRFPNFSQWTVHRIWDDLLKDGRRIPAVGGSDAHHLVEWQSEFFGHGNPTTWVYADEHTAEGILAGIKSGHVTISYAPSAVRLDFSADADGDGTYETMAGDTIDHEPGQAISFRIRFASSPEDVPAAEEAYYELNASSAGNEVLTTTYLHELLPLFFSLSDENSTNLYGLGIYKNGRVFKALLLCGLTTVTFSDIPKPSLPTYYRVELYGRTHRDPLYAILYGMEIGLTNPIYINYH